MRRRGPVMIALRVAAAFAALAAVFAAAMSGTAAQDIRGLEICTAEKQMDRRTGCLQANVEFLQQTLTRATRDFQDRLAASARDLAAANGEIAAMKRAIAALQRELADIRKKPETSKPETSKPDARPPAR